MSVISVFEATPNRVRALTRLIAALGTPSRDKLFAMTMPSLTPADGQREQFANLLKTTAGLGLITTSGRNKVELASSVSVDDASSTSWFFSHVERQLLCPSDPDSDNFRFRYALSWLLAQMPGTEIPWTSEQNIVMNRQLNGDDVYELNSAGRFAMLCYWARFLGYATALKLKKTVIVVPDPTTALERLLSSIFGDANPLTIGEFLEAASKQTPVLEGGVVRIEVDQRFKVPRPDRQLSAATSLALARLERRGRLKQFRLDDAKVIWTTPRITVDGEPASADRLSHIERG